MNQCFKILHLALVACHQAPEVLQPRVRALNDPAPLVPSQLPPVLMRRHPVVLPPRNNRLNLTLVQKRPRRVAVVAAVGDQALRFVRATTFATSPLYFDIVERTFKELDFGRGSLFHEYSERSTRAICQNHKLCALPALGLANA